MTASEASLGTSLFDGFHVGAPTGVPPAEGPGLMTHDS